MKRIWLTLILLMIIGATGYAQSNPNAQAIRESQQYCPNLFNPQRFNVQGANPALASWQGYAGGSNYGGTGKMGNAASTCGNWDMTFGKGPATGAQIDAAQANLSTEPSSWIFYGNSGACGYNSTPQDLSHKRFRIMSTGMDPLTHGALSQVPPSDPDTTFTNSIRLGNHCGGGQQAEKLIYQFKVRPQNALLVLYYALSLEDARHDAAANPEFVIEVQVGQPKAGTRPSDLNTYQYSSIGEQLFYGQPTPVSGGQLAPFQSGGSGTNGSQNNVYLPWNKVVINLGQYLNKPIRICIGTGDCAYSVHYAYSYIAGYCRPMKITVDGCPLDTGNTVSSLQAPSGLKDPTYTADPNYHAYKWYRCTDPTIVGDQIDMTQGNDDTWFYANFEQIPGAYDSVYHTTIEEFTMNGQMVPKRAYACEMTTFMNKKTNNSGIRTYPIKSRLFADASNQKPQIGLGENPRCDGTVKLISTSYCGTANFMKDTSTTWTLYDNPACTGNSLEQKVGDSVTFHTTGAGTYYVKMHVPTTTESCYSEGKFEIHAIENPRPDMTISNMQPCLGDEVSLSDASEHGTERTWYFSDGTTSVEQNLVRTFELENDTVKMVVKNDYTEIIGNDLNNQRQCADSIEKVIHVFTSPNLTISDDTIVCEGQRTNVTVSIADDDPNATYEYDWYRHLDRDGENSIQSGNILQQIPDEQTPTSTYYVKVTRMPQGCVAWDSVTVHVVRPTLTIKPSNGKICPGETVQLVGANAHHFSWLSTPEDPSLIGQETNDTINVTPTVNTTYTLIGHGSDDCNADPLSKNITIFQTPIPEIKATPDFVDSEDPVVTFSDVSRYGESTKWEFGEGITSTQRQVSHTFSNISNTEYVTVKMTSFNALGTQSEGCKASTSIDLPVQLFAVWIPNMFTPTMVDNNVFKIFTNNILEYFSVRIMDRHGQQVFYSTDQKFEWDGTYKNALCPQGAYVYIIKYRRPGTAEVTTRQGTISLIR